MANQQYPSDGKTPVQTLTFHYQSGGTIYFHLHPQPDAKRSVSPQWTSPMKCLVGQT